MPCFSCDGAATILMKHEGVELAYACFPCADTVMRVLALQNVEGGATRAQTADGYVRWRAYVGVPCTRDEAAALFDK